MPPKPRRRSKVLQESSSSDEQEGAVTDQSREDGDENTASRLRFGRTFKKCKTTLKEVARRLTPPKRQPRDRPIVPDSDMEGAVPEEVVGAESGSRVDASRIPDDLLSDTDVDFALLRSTRRGERESDCAEMDTGESLLEDTDSSTQERLVARPPQSFAAAIPDIFERRPDEREEE